MDTVIGILELAAYVLVILGLSAAVTFAVIRISPAQSAKKRDADETGS
jgi:hypothetical protein